MPHEVRTVVGPDRAILPTGEPFGSPRIVDTRIEAASVEAQRIRNAKVNPLSFPVLGNEHVDRVGVGTGGHRRVLREARSTELVGPVEVMELRRNVGALEPRTGCLI